MWVIDQSPDPLSPTKYHSSVDLLLKPSGEDLKIWPRRFPILKKNLSCHFIGKEENIVLGFDYFSFELRLRITLTDGKLTLIPRVRNTDSKAFSFTFALRNHLSVSDIRFALIFHPSCSSYYSYSKHLVYSKEKIGLVM